MSGARGSPGTAAPTTILNLVRRRGLVSSPFRSAVQLVESIQTLHLCEVNSTHNGPTICYGYNLDGQGACDDIHSIGASCKVRPLSRSLRHPPRTEHSPPFHPFSLPLLGFLRRGRQALLAGGCLNQTQCTNLLALNLQSYTQDVISIFGSGVCTCVANVLIGAVGVVACDRWGKVPMGGRVFSAFISPSVLPQT